MTIFFVLMMTTTRCPVSEASPPRLFHNVLCRDGATRDLAVRAGRFVDANEVGADAEVVDLNGLLALPPFVEGHIHLDKSFVGDDWRPHRPADDLRERLAIEKRLLAGARPVRERADALLAQAHRFGTVAMRSHVDIDAALGLDHLHSVMAACEPWRGRVDVELVAFPQAGILASPGTADLLDAAIREGAGVVGGLDPSAFDGDADAHLDVVFGVAERHGVKIDIHLHEPGPQGIEQLRRIASRTKAAAMRGAVAVSHAYALGDVDRDNAARTADLLADAGVAIMTNAPGNRAFPPIKLLRDAGVRVFAGNDNIRDAWWPYGDADMLGRAAMIGYRSGFFTDADLAVALDMATTEAAAVLGRERYGMGPGDEATFVLVDADNASAAVAAPPRDRRLVQRGEIVSTPPSRLQTTLAPFDRSGDRS
ncbi:amidohydrolase family protein [Sphingomonas panni]|uniref:amidohydrolase family protein n=1 Tax=Sphingomonas panni TaxID=237612 RepID=UPI001F5B22C4|nr:amidohydrolase family protein [Sphingomonas panni]